MIPERTTIDAIMDILRTTSIATFRKELAAMSETDRDKLARFFLRLVEEIYRIDAA